MRIEFIDLLSVFRQNGFFFLYFLYQLYMVGIWRPSYFGIWMPWIH